MDIRADTSTTRFENKAEPAGRTDEELLDRIYRLAVTARAVDELLWILSRQGRASFVLTSRGHEVAQVASAVALRVGHDSAWLYYRDLAAGLALGIPPYEVFLGALARADDPHSGGRQLTMHFSSPRLRIGSLTSVVAGHIPHAVGAAHAAHVLGEDSVALCYFGDGATSEGATHEAMNFAGVHRLPVVFFCENNGYGISVPQRLQMPVARVADRASAYGMPGFCLDGADALAVYRTTQAAIERARNGEGPTLIEARVPRITAHSSQDDDAYRSAEERAAAAAADPLPRLRGELLARGVLTEAEDRALVESIRTEVQAAVDRAMARPEPEPSRARRWLYAGDPPHPHVVARNRGDSPDGPSVVAPISTESDPRGITLVQAVHDAIAEEMARDPRVVVLGQDVGHKGGVFRVTQGLQAAFGETRVLDTPISEIAIAGVSIGAAMMGLRPVAEFQFADYIHPAFDQIVNQAATIRWRSVGGWGVPAVFRTPFGAGVNGGIYHSQSVEALYCHIPGLKVVVPATPRDAKGLLKAAIRDDDPVLFFEHKKSYRRYREAPPPPDEVIPLGVARLDRPGSDLSIVTYGVGVHQAREAAEVLAAEGISVEILDLRTLIPFDREAIAQTVQKTNKVLILHEANKTMGFGAEIAAFIGEELFMDLDGPITRVAAADCHLPYNTPEEAAIIPNPQWVVEAARKLAAF